MSPTEGASDLLLAEEWIPKSIKAVRAGWIHGVAKYVTLAVDNLDKDEVDRFIEEKLGDWRFQKPFVHYFLKFIEQPPGLRERLCEVMGALSLTDGSNQFAERLRKTSRLLDDLEVDSLRSLYVFGVRYAEHVESTPELTLRRLEYAFQWSTPPEDGFRYFRLVSGKPVRDWDYGTVSDWFQMEDRMVDVLVSHLGTRFTGLDTQPAEEPRDGRGSGLARFSSDVDGTVRLIHRVLELADVDSLTW